MTQTTKKGLAAAQAYYSEDEQAEYRTGSDDLPAYWYSQANLVNGETETASGMFIPTGRKDFDEAVEAYNEQHQGKQLIQRVTVLHDESNENGFKKAGQSPQKEYWLLPVPTIGDKNSYSLSFAVICKGLKKPMHDLGIMLAWNTKQGGTVLRFRAFLVELADYGFVEPICISANGLGKGKIGFLDGFLYSQIKVSTGYKAITGSKVALPYYAFCLSLGKTKPTSVGSTKSKNMILPVALVPQEITEAYLEEHLLLNAESGEILTERIRELLPETVEWATQTFNTIDQSDKKDDTSQEAPPVDEDAPMFDENGNEIKTTRKFTTEASRPATTEQRNALIKMADRIQRPDLKDMANDPELTYALAGSVLIAAQSKKQN